MKAIYLRQTYNMDTSVIYTMSQKL